MRRTSSAAIQQDNENEEPPKKKRKFFHWPQLFLRWYAAEQEVPVPQVNIDTLPDECVSTILSFLSFQELVEAAHNVCCQWRRVSHDPALWRNKEYLVDKNKSDDEVITFLQQWPEVCNVIIKRPVGPPVINGLCNCSRLKTLKFDRAQQVEYSLLKKLLEKCCNIRELTISHQQLDDDNKAQVLAQLKSLQSLDIEHCWKCTEPIHLRPVADGCPELARLILSSLVQFYTEDLEYLINVKCKKLTHLGLPVAGSNKRSVVPLLKCCTSLTDLVLVAARDDYDEIVVDVTTVGQLSSLHSLILKSIFQCQAESVGVAVMTGNFTHLQVLELSNGYLDDSTVVDICFACPKLKEFRLRYCSGLTDEALRHLSRLRYLEKFGLDCCQGMHGAALAYVTKVPNLQKLSLECWDLKTLDPGLEYILDISKLETLSFAFCRDASTFPFERIPAKLIKLRYLNVAACELNKRVLKQLKKEMPDLVVYAPTFQELFPDSHSKGNNVTKNNLIYLGIGMIGMVTSVFLTNFLSGII